MYAIVAAVLIVIIIGVAAYMLLFQGGNGDGTTTPTPTPGPIAVADADSLQFAVDATSDGMTSTVKYYAKGLGTSVTMIRIEVVVPDMGDIVYLFGGDHTVWSNDVGTWTDYTEQFAAQWDQWWPVFEGYVDSLAHWTEGEYTSPDGNVRIYNIVINPTLADSMFEPPAT